MGVTHGRGTGWRRVRRKWRGGGAGGLFWGVVVKADDCTVMSKDVLLGKVELPGEDFKELSLYPVHVSLAENTGSESPVDVP
jgi:hypothetical protein